MSDPDQTATIDPGAPAPPSARPATQVQDPAPPSYAGPEQPSFLDRVLGMRAVIAVALAALVIGGLSGFILGEHTQGGDHGFGHGGPAGSPGGQGFRGPEGGPGQHGPPPFGQGQSMR